jgi:hypothetical protein
MRVLLALALALAVLSSPPAAHAADPVIGSFEYAPIGYPRSTGRMVFEATIIISGKPVTKTVTIPSGAIKPYTPASRLPTDTDAQFAQKIADARGAGSLAKAHVIADAINKAFEKEFMGTGLKVTVANFPKTETINVGGVPIRDITATYGSIIIPNVAQNNNTPLKFSENGVIGQGGNGGRFLPPPPKGSAGSRGSLDRMTPGVQTAASGLDAEGEPSVVQFGIEDQYVAEIFPGFGQSDALILQLLASDLVAHGIAAIFDPSLISLYLDMVIPDGTRVIWGNTDTGLDYTFTMVGLAAAIPEPGSLIILVAGLAGLAMLGRCRAARGPAIAAKG